MRASEAQLRVAVQPQERQTQPRDRSLDALRGIAIVMMITSHVGSRGLLAMAANFPYEISAADPFVIVSGATAGWIARNRLARTAPQPQYQQALRRAGRLYVIHCVLTLLVLGIHEYSGRLRAPSVESVGGWFAAVLAVLTLRVQPTDYMNILPLFVVFQLLSPLCLALLRKGQALLLLLLSGSLWGVAQFVPSIIPLPDPAFEASSFSLAAWQFAFVASLTLGYHRAELSSWVQRAAPYTTWSFVALVSLGFLIAQLHRNSLRRFSPLPSSWEWAWDKSTFAPLHALYVMLILTAAYLLLERLSNPTPPRFWKRLLEPLESIGQKSLYCFIMHLPFALFASAVALHSRSTLLQDAAIVGAVLGVYAAARFGLFARFLKV